MVIQILDSVHYLLDDMLLNSLVAGLKKRIDKFLERRVLPRQVRLTQVLFAALLSSWLHRQVDLERLLPWLFQLRQPLALPWVLCGQRRKSVINYAHDQPAPSTAAGRSSISAAAYSP